MRGVEFVFLRSVGRISNNSKASCCIWMFSYQWLWRLLPCGMWNHVSVFIVEVSETLKIEAVHYSETLEYIYQITRFQSPQPRILNVNLLFYLIKMTNKMQPCRTIYYSIVPWLLYMFRAILSILSSKTSTGIKPHITKGSFSSSSHRSRYLRAFLVFPRSSRQNS